MQEATVKDRLLRWSGVRTAPWKRSALLLTSIVVLIGCGVAAYFQWTTQWASNEVWYLIGVVGVLGILSVGVALFADDKWVALVLGSV